MPWIFPHKEWMKVSALLCYCSNGHRTQWHTATASWSPGLHAWKKCLQMAVSEWEFSHTQKVDLVFGSGLEPRSVLVDLDSGIKVDLMLPQNTINWFHPCVTPPWVSSYWSMLCHNNISIAWKIICPLSKLPSDTSPNSVDYWSVQ